MKKYRFRGQVISSDQWVFGSLIFTYNCHYILSDEFANINDDQFGRSFMQVKSETVSLMIGTDIDGNELFEDDIILTETDKIESIQFSEFGYYPFEYSDYGVEQNLPQNCKKIGNRFDNPSTYKGLYNIEARKEEIKYQQERAKDPSYEPDDLPF